jgi:hypothetical protein
MSLFNAPPLTYGNPFPGSSLPSNWQVTGNKSAWWKNLLRGTGTFFLNGLTNSANAQNSGNPYGGSAFQVQQSTIMGLLPLLLIFLLFKK